MKKEKGVVKIISSSKQIEEQIEITKKENNYYFLMKDNSRNIFSLTDISLIRETEEFFLELYFKEESKANSKIYLKKEHLELPLEIVTLNMIIEKNKIEIKYNLNEEEYFFLMKLEGENK